MLQASDSESIRYGPTVKIKMAEGSPQIHMNHFHANRESKELPEILLIPGDNALT
jgi:hypothetical protein